MTEPDDRQMDEVGRRRVAEFVHAALGWAGMNASKRFTGTGRISRATLDRVKQGQDVSPTLLRALGEVLELPRDYLLYIGYGDVDRIQKLAEETTNENRRDLIRWTLDHLFPDDNPPHSHRRTA